MTTPETELSRDELKDMYQEMLLIRRFEDRMEDLFEEGLIPSSIHLYHGQEAVAVGIWNALSEEDMALTNHRPDGHIVAKGCDLGKTYAEFFGRQDGPCSGKGGTMHYCSVEDNFYGSNGIVGGNLPHAVGLGYANRLLDTDGIVVCSFGDGASNIGMFGESLNMSSLWDVPVLWVCENNQYAETTRVDTSTAGSIAERASGYDMPYETVDAMDVVEVYETVSEYGDVVRSGTPALLEMQCYRYKGHSRADEPYGPDHYRQEEEVKEWEQRDPIPNLADRIDLDNDEIEAIEAEIDSQLTEAAEFARNSPKQTPEGLQ